MTDKNQITGFLIRENLQSLIDVLKNSGFACVGPQIKDGTIIYDTLDNTEALPKNVQDKQSAGSYRLFADTKVGYFNWANGPQAIKPFVFSPREVIWKVEKRVDGVPIFENVENSQKATAIIGVKPCDVQALKLMDKHFLYGEYLDDHYHDRRKNLLLVSVNCSYSSAMCFCHQTGDGPTVKDGSDILMTELDEGFIVVSGSEKGENILAHLQLTELKGSHRKQAEAQQKATLNALQKNASAFDNKPVHLDVDHSRWDEVAKRCLSCGNCTMVCPTCFCHSQSDESDISGNSSQHFRHWDSCFSHDHSYIHGIVIRAETRNRYRQWLMHKFTHWVTQYGRSGCVGCGRCRTWCPAGIDILEELSAIRK